VTEIDFARGKTRVWMEAYDHNGNVVRVHPKAIDSVPIDKPHYPPTGKDLERGCQ
jgi:filamentous hemagglutinin